MRLNSIAQVGGVNSIENFARSWQRAAGFYEIAPARSSFAVSEHAVDPGERRSLLDEEHGPKQHRSLLRQQLEQHGASPEEAIHDDREPESSVETPELGESNNSPPGRGSDIFAHAPHLFATSYGSVSGSLASNLNESSRRHAARLFEEQQLTGVQEPDKEREPLLVQKVVREDGKTVNVVVGQSTVYQTVFNEINVLIGIGLLSLPLGIRYAGWFVGLIFLSSAAVVTGYTARILAKCLDVDNSLITFADLAYISFGQKARIATSILFSFELIAACVALVVLFADSLDALVPGWGVTEWKIFCTVLLVPLSFVPLRMLSFSSILGIICCIGSEI